ncbi:Transcription factor bHLH143 [Striga hermonthica]|uniref:Transcription factor bHLH143 n=1 Tax=Striga hermonthica TaxID=68872 RepID=A0A9N7NHR5_STRHE|nr:Transcription factor bHLH143 [Striga hermonthica]
MFWAKESENISYLDHMALLRHGQNYSVPFFLPSELTANLSAFPGQSASNYLLAPNTGQENAADRFSKPMPQNRNISFLTKNQLVGIKPIDDTLYAPQKRFLIFDQSEYQTKLFFSPSFPPQNHAFAPITPSSAKGPLAEMTAGVNPEFSTNPIFEEKWGENCLTDGEGEHDFPEDTEEIDALFFSDSDDYDNEDDDDEVASTGHTPSVDVEGYYDDKLVEEPIEQVVDSNDTHKRQKLLDSTFKKSPWTGHGNLCGYEIDSVKREKKVKIRQALRILESIIPGSEEKDPLSVIDKAIVYLKSMRTEAETLGLRYSGDESVISP